MKYILLLFVCSCSFPDIPNECDFITSESNFCDFANARGLSLSEYGHDLINVNHKYLNNGTYTSDKIASVLGALNRLIKINDSYSDYLIHINAIKNYYPDMFIYNYLEDFKSNNIMYNADINFIKLWISDRIAETINY